MEIIHRKFSAPSRSDCFRIVPLGDIHLGNKACDEDLLRRVIKRIKDEDLYWIGMGDYCEYICRQDNKRFDSTNLADWIKPKDYMDIPGRQMTEIKSLLAPIASKCLGLIDGTHEYITLKNYSRNVYQELMDFIKQTGGLMAEKLDLSFYGWIMLHFNRAETSMMMYKICAMHGARAGDLEGSKALNMQRWLWTHDCDLALIGHNHSTNGYKVDVINVNDLGEVRQDTRRGAYTGSFFRTNIEGSTSYAERLQLLPLPIGGLEVQLYPGKEWERRDKMRIVI